MTPVTTTQSVPLAERTTLRLGGPAARFVHATTPAELVEAVRTADAAADEKVLVLGGGSNLVISDGGFDGTVVHVATKGFRLDPLGGGIVQFTVEAGEEWDAVVAEAVAQGLGGLECLSGIPGSNGATPVQNVGAYGVEISQVLQSVDLLDRRSGKVHQVPAAKLGLDYRTSVLKGTDNAVVLRTRFSLTAGGMSAPIRYAELARVLGVAQGERVPADEARKAVLELRRGKGMVLDPADHDTWSAGSFFTNPIIDDSTFTGVLIRIAERLGADVDVPTYPAGHGHEEALRRVADRARRVPQGPPGPRRPGRVVRQAHAGADEPRRRVHRGPARPGARGARRRAIGLRGGTAPGTGLRRRWAVRPFG